MGGGNQLFGVRVCAFSEARVVRVGALEGAAPKSHTARSATEVAVPMSHGSTLRHDSNLLSTFLEGPVVLPNAPSPIHRTPFSGARSPDGHDPARRPRRFLRCRCAARRSVLARQAAGGGRIEPPCSRADCFL